MKKGCRINYFFQGPFVGHENVMSPFLLVNSINRSDGDDPIEPNLNMKAKPMNYRNLDHDWGV